MKSINQIKLTIRLSWIVFTMGTLQFQSISEEFFQMISTVSHPAYSYFVYPCLLQYRNGLILQFMYCNKKQKISIQKVDFALRSPSSHHVSGLKAQIDCKLIDDARPFKQKNSIDQSTQDNLKYKGAQTILIKKSLNNKQANKVIYKESKVISHEMWEKNKLITQPIDRSQCQTPQLLEPMQHINRKYSQHIYKKQKENKIVKRGKMNIQLENAGKNNNYQGAKNEVYEQNDGKLKMKEIDFEKDRNRCQSVINSKQNSNRQQKRCPFSSHNSRRQRFRPVKQLKEEQLITKWLNVDQTKKGQLKVSHLVQIYYVKSLLQKVEGSKAKLEKINSLIKLLETNLAKQSKKNSKLFTANILKTGQSTRQDQLSQKEKPLFKCYFDLSCQLNSESVKPQSNNQISAVQKKQKFEPKKSQNNGKQYPINSSKNEEQVNTLPSKLDTKSKHDNTALNSISMSIVRNNKVQSLNIQRNKILNLYKNLLGKKNYKKEVTKQKTFPNASILINQGDISEPNQIIPHKNFLRKGHGRYAQLIKQINLNMLMKSKQSSLNHTPTQKSLGKKQPDSPAQVVDQQAEPILIQKSNSIIESEQKTESEMVTDRKDSIQDGEIENLILRNRKLFGLEPSQTTPNLVSKKSKILRTGLRNRRRQSIRKINTEESRKNRMNKTEESSETSWLKMQNNVMILGRRGQIRKKSSIIMKDKHKKLHDRKRGSIVLKNENMESHQRNQEEKILNQLQVVGEQQLQINLSSRMELIRNSGAKNEKEQGKDGQNRIKQLKQLKQQFKKMLQHKVDIEGPSVFCRFGIDRNNKIGFNGMKQFQQIYAFKKPKYIQSSYSIKNNKYSSSLYSFNQDSFEIDFMKAFCSQAGRLGQKQLSKN